MRRWSVAIALLAVVALSFICMTRAEDDHLTSERDVESVGANKARRWGYLSVAMNEAAGGIDGWRKVKGFVGNPFPPPGTVSRSTCKRTRFTVVAAHASNSKKSAYMIAQDNKGNTVVTFTGPRAPTGNAKPSLTKLHIRGKPKGQNGKGRWCLFCGKAPRPFVNAYMALRRQLWKDLKANGLKKRKGKVVFTGFDSGAAYASYAAMDVSRNKLARRRRSIRLVTFGSPRTGNKRFGKRMRKLVKKKFVTRFVLRAKKQKDPRQSRPAGVSQAYPVFDLKKKGRSLGSASITAYRNAMKRKGRAGRRKCKVSRSAARKAKSKMKKALKKAAKVARRIGGAVAAGAAAVGAAVSGSKKKKDAKSKKDAAAQAKGGKAGGKKGAGKAGDKKGGKDGAKAGGKAGGKSGAKAAAQAGKGKAGGKTAAKPDTATSKSAAGASASKKGERSAAGWNRPQDLEDCMACKYTLSLLQQRVGNTYNQESLHNNFQIIASYAEATSIFYPAVQDLRDDFDEIASNYMEQQSVDQMCRDLWICKPKAIFD